MLSRVVSHGLPVLVLAIVLLTATCAPIAPTVSAQEPAGKETIKSIMALLQTEIDMKDFQAPNLTLKDFLGLLLEKAQGLGKELPILLDQDAFRAEDPNSPDIYDTPVRVPPFPRRMTLATALRLALRKVPSGNATYLILPTHIHITTASQATPEKQLVQAMFVNQPLEKVLEELSSLSGIGVILDARVGDKAKTMVTARFPNATTLTTAVRLVADMADLKVVIAENVL
jgi:hypothetical protein